MSALNRYLIACAGLVGLVCANAQESELMNRSDPLPGITAAGQPTEAALEGLAKDGFVAVIDLRAASENRGFDEKAAVEGLGMTYIPLPVAGGTDVTFDNAGALAKILAEIDGPVLVHCASSNRVGALLALRASMDGASDEEALSLGDAAGLSSLRATVVERLEQE